MPAYGNLKKTNFTKMTIRILDPTKEKELEETFYQAGHYETVNAFIVDLIVRGLKEKKLEMKRIQKIIPQEKAEEPPSEKDEFKEKVADALAEIIAQGEMNIKLGKSNNAILSTLSAYTLGDEDGYPFDEDLARAGKYTKTPSYSIEKDEDCLD